MRYRIFHGRGTRNTCLSAKYPNGSRLRPASHHCREELILRFGLHRLRDNVTLNIQMAYRAAPTALPSFQNPQNAGLLRVLVI